MLFGIGLAFFLGKPLIKPTAPRLPAIPFGWWSASPQVQAALKVNALLLVVEWHGRLTGPATDCSPPR